MTKGLSLEVVILSNSQQISLPWTCPVLLNPSELPTGISTACYLKNHIMLFHLAFILPPLCFLWWPLVLELEVTVKSWFLALAPCQSWLYRSLSYSLLHHLFFQMEESQLSYPFWPLSQLLAFEKAERFLILFHHLWEGDIRTEYAVQNVGDPWIYRVTFI